MKRFCPHVRRWSTQLLLGIAMALAATPAQARDMTGKGGAGMLVDDEIPTKELLELYIQYVVPHLPPPTPGLVDD